MRIFKIEYLKNRIICCLVLSLNDRIVHASFLYTLVVLKYCFAMKANPCVFRRRYRYFYLRIYIYGRTKKIRADFSGSIVILRIVSRSCKNSFAAHAFYLSGIFSSWTNQRRYFLFEKCKKKYD